ncbi:MAG: DUF86 domain-containing protein [Phycisphaerae bacterium]|nr:DUF86 domain-containing protein [Saprospiraceae bacterium]
MPADNKLAGKVLNLETCIARILEVYQGDRQTFLLDLLRQESVLLNLQRACENVIDIANIAVAELDLGVPASARESFELLQNAAIVSLEMASQMATMVGFRNLLVHQYFRIDPEKVCNLIEEDLQDLQHFANVVVLRLSGF